MTGESERIGDPTSTNDQPAQEPPDATQVPTPDPRQKPPYQIDDPAPSRDNGDDSGPEKRHA
jgi:hypothetical protein